MHENDWKSFEKTGCVTDYLRYKGVYNPGGYNPGMYNSTADDRIVNKAEEMRECTNAESGNSNGNYHQIRTY